MSAFIVRATGYSTTAQKIDEGEVRRALRVLADPQAGCQLFALPARRKVHRAGNDLDGLVEGVKSLANQNHIYVVLNPLPVDFEDHANNEAILRRRWIFVDIDPNKSANHKNDPATAEEKECVILAAQMVRDHLESLSWPAPIEVDSGNGWYLIYSTDLPNTAEIAELVSRFLTSMKPIIGGKGKIDSAVRDARRIARVPGTENRKGIASEERPWRRCKLIAVPKDLGLVSREMLEAACQKEESGQHEPSVNGHAEKQSAFVLKAGSDKANRYVQRALELEAGAVMSAPEHTRNNRLNTAAFSLGTLIPNGYLVQAEIEARLFSAACRCGLDVDPECGEEGIRRTIQSGIKGGVKHPRVVESNRAYATVEPPKPEDEAPAEWGLYLDDEVLAEGDAKSILEPVENLGDKQGRAVFQIYTLPTLMTTQFPPPSWVVQGLLSEGLNILAGKPKMGKSILALNLAMTISGGGLALGNSPVEQGDVLYLALEDKFRRVQARAKKMSQMVGHTISKHLSLATEWRRCDVGGLKLLDKWIGSVSQPRLVIIDVWPMFKPAPKPGSRKSAYDEDYAAFGDLKKFCDKRGINCLVLLHCRKGLSEDVLDEVSGTLGQVGASDGILVLSRSRTNGDAKVFVCGRDVDEQELSLAFDLPTLTWKSLGSTAEHVQGTLQVKIVEYLKTHPPAFNKDIALALDAHEESVRKALSKLMDKHMVRRVGNSYSWPGEKDPEETTI